MGHRQIGVFCENAGAPRNDIAVERLGICEKEMDEIFNRRRHNQLQLLLNITTVHLKISIADEEHISKMNQAMGLRGRKHGYDVMLVDHANETEFWFRFHKRMNFMC